MGAAAAAAAGARVDCFRSPPAGVAVSTCRVRVVESVPCGEHLPAGDLWWRGVVSSSFSLLCSDFWSSSSPSDVVEDDSRGDDSAAACCVRMNIASASSRVRASSRVKTCEKMRVSAWFGLTGFVITAQRCD